MDNSLFAYLQQLELLFFFSGYPLIYTVIIFITGNHQDRFKMRLSSSLPYAYALVGTLYLGLQLKNLYPHYSFENIKLSIQQPWLVAWGILSLLFWIPAFARKKVLSLLHSLVFFSFILRDVFLQISGSSTDRDILKNDMKIFADSLILNLGALGLIVLFSFLLDRSKKR